MRGMVLFVLTRAGFDDMKPLISAHEASVWINGGVLSADEVNALWNEGLDLTPLSYQIDPYDRAGIVSELEMIQLHHPGHRIWIEMRYLNLT
jgi:hypothetical protein